MGYLEHIAKKCAQRTHHALRPHAVGPRLLDVGAAEGFMGELLNDDGFDVTLLDVYDANQSNLPHIIYNGRDFPFPDYVFDTTIISLVLHHCKDHERVLREAIRVTRRRLIISESVYRSRPGKWILWWADTLFNGVRSGGSMPRALHFKRIETWQRIFSEHDLTSVKEIDMSRGIHRHVLFVLDCPSPKLNQSAFAPATRSVIGTCQEAGCQHVE